METPKAEAARLRRWAKECRTDADKIEGVGFTLPRKDLGDMASRLRSVAMGLENMADRVEGEPC